MADSNSDLDRIDSPPQSRSRVSRVFDVAIIGGGVIGSALAWSLARRGRNVVIIERLEPGKEASFAAGGMLAAQAECDPSSDFFRLAIASRNAYPEFVRELEQSTGLAVGYRTEGTLVAAFRPEDDSHLNESYNAQLKAGLDVELLDAHQVLRLEPSLNNSVRSALRFPGDHQIDNRLLTQALEQAARMAGVTICSGSEALEVCAEGSAVQSVKTSTETIEASCVVVAAGCWSGNLKLPSPFLSKAEVSPVRGQMMAFGAPASPLRSVVYSPRGYLIPRSSGVIIAGSTTEHVGFNKAVTESGLASIAQAAEEMMPLISELPIIETWSGLRPGTSDDLPVLGQDPAIRGLYYATGHYRNGILLTPVTAQAISELIVHGTSSVDISAFSVTRFADRSVAG